jgi:hypothetical protein
MMIYPMASHHSLVVGTTSSQATTSVSTAGAQSAGMMNRRPKINDNNIKLIEKVIKRQNATA